MALFGRKSRPSGGDLSQVIDLGIPDIRAQVASHPSGDRLITASPQGRPQSPYDWGLAAAAIFSAMHQVPWDVVPYPDKEHSDTMLRDWWGITDRESLLQQVYWLLCSGHRVWMEDEVRGVRDLGPERAQELITILEEKLAAADSGDLREQLWRVRQISANKYGIATIDMLVWDFVRAIMLMREGTTLGYVTEAQTCDLMALVQPSMQQHYDSWVALGRNFVLSRWLWNGEGDSTLFYAVNGLGQLLAPKSPWSTVPFNAPPPPVNGSFMSALAASGVIHPLSADERADATPWMLYLDQLLASTPMGR